MTCYGRPVSLTDAAVLVYIIGWGQNSLAMIKEMICLKTKIILVALKLFSVLLKSVLVPPRLQNNCN